MFNLVLSIIAVALAITGLILSLLRKQGPKGDTGERGLPGPKGDQGPQGDRGPRGSKGADFKFSDFTPEQLEGLRGPKGDKGDTEIVTVSEGNVSLKLNKEELLRVLESDGPIKLNTKIYAESFHEM